MKKSKFLKIQFQSAAHFFQAHFQ